ncbi:MAG: hypothetical protein JNK34_06320 [Tabrizicola sp.]|nr:hypothetical protein [Tabrizicola sp.]
MSKILTLAHKRPARLSHKLREAIRLHETEGLSVTDACGKAGLSRAAWYKAIKRAETQTLIRQARRDFIEGADAKKAFLKVKALEVALDLMLNSKSEAIRARMVEFLASDAKVSPVAVHIDARHAEVPTGYRYKRPPSLGGPDDIDDALPA